MNKDNSDFIEYRIADHIREVMRLLDIKTTDDSVETPARIAKMLNRELFANRHGGGLKELENKMTTFNNPNINGTPIIMKNIKFNSTCEHHWLPFYGYCDIECIAGSRILGASKFARVVKHFSKKPQVQERLTREIGEFLVSILRPQYLKVTLRDVHHTCIEVRGIEADCEMDTSWEWGVKEGYSNARS